MSSKKLPRQDGQLNSSYSSFLSENLSKWGNWNFEGITYQIQPGAFQSSLIYLVFYCFIEWKNTTDAQVLSYIKFYVHLCSQKFRPDWNVLHVITNYLNSIPFKVCQKISVPDPIPQPQSTGLKFSFGVEIIIHGRPWEKLLYMNGIIPLSIHQIML